MLIRRLPRRAHSHLSLRSAHSTTLLPRTPTCTLPLRSTTNLSNTPRHPPHLHPFSSLTLPHPSPFHLPRRSLFGFSAPQPVSQTIRRRVPFSPSTFFSVILDVSSYHLFLPFCVASTVQPSPSSSPSSSPSPSSPSTFTAQLTVGFRVFTESYTSRVTSNPPHSIAVSALQSSIFHHLNSTWTFTPVPTDPHSCDVSFTIDFLVKSRMHAGAVQMFFGDVTEQQMKAFVKRAAQVERERGREGRESGVGATSRGEQVVGEEGEGGQGLAAAATKPQAIDAPVVDMAVPPPPAPRTAPNPPTAKRAPPPPASLPVRPVREEQQEGQQEEQVMVAQPTKRLLHSSPVRFTDKEMQQLRALFREYASGRGARGAGEASGEAEAAPTLSEMTEEHAQHPEQRTQPPATPSSYPHLTKGGEYVHETGAKGAPLLLTFPTFCHLCAHLALPTSGVFTKYRERASLRACAEDEAIAVACFASQPSLYRYAGSGLEGDDASPAFTHSHPLHRHPSPSPHSSPSTPTVTRASVLHSPGLSFGECMDVLWGLVRATNGERLQSALLKAAAKEGGEGRLSEERLRAETLAFFALQLGIIRQVMPAMVVRRSRDMDRELGIQRPTTREGEEGVEGVGGGDGVGGGGGGSAPLADPSGRGLYVLAMVGVMETVLTETERALGEAMGLLLVQLQREGKEGGKGGGLSVKEWSEWWERQAELLAVMTVPGQSSLIQWASATQTAETFASKHRDKAAQSRLGGSA